MIRTALAIIHVLVGASLFGAMAYSFFVLHPRAKSFFARQTDFESFVAAVSHGARWQVLGALAVIGMSGVGLAVTSMVEPWSIRSWTLPSVKIAAWTAALLIFWRVSWRLWPARILATETEIPHFHRVFRRSAAAMLTLIGLGMILGVLARC